MDATWRTSTRSGSTGNCVEARRIGDTAEVRDSKDPAGPVLAFGRSAWSAFVVSLRQNHGG
ncbi:DUF397 domain-containing protein [Solwaraspora sp. WMMD1047]|uniref:DUF397 domain-containing protein n=1 Tax=Solwaraspora sp. WMMD1047 TaxID=3016102 RepID=UPI00241762CA|nr:DUF397 domain-containing protein [Solwaraspora sp. WMMD1047]MDG4829896.1 DUF397 domain-containing protein [Solwaraspora sp. WMMD1047]